MAKGSQEQVIRNTGLMTLGTLASRVTGLLRTWVMGFVLGTTMVASAYNLANNLPNMIFELVAGGFLSTAFLPVLLLQKEQFGRRGANRYTSNILNITIILLGALSVICCVFAPTFVEMQTFTIDKESAVFAQTVAFFRVFAFQIVFYGLGGVVTGVLNAERSFFLTSVAPMLNNVCVIASFLGYYFLFPVNPDVAFWVLAVGTTLGVAIQFTIQIPALRRTGFKWQPYLSLRDPAIVETMRITIPSLIYIIASVVAVFFRQAFALQTGNNGPSVLAYAWMWYQLPYGVVAVSLSSTMLTEMSDDVARGDYAAFRGHAMRGVSGTLFLIIPLTGMLFALATPILQLFHAGAFTADDVVLVSDILRIWVLSLPLYAVTMYLYKAFAALRKLTAFALINCAMTGVQMACYVLLTTPETFGLFGIPIGDFAYYTLRGIVSLLLLRYYVSREGVRGQERTQVMRTTLLTLIATLIGTGAAAGLLVPLAAFDGAFSVTALSIAWALVKIVVCGIVGLFVSFGLCKVFRVAESDLVDRLVRRLFGRFLPAGPQVRGKHVRK